MDQENLIGKYVKNKKSGNIFGKITGTGTKYNRKEKQNKPVVITNYSKITGRNSYAFLDRKDITWEAVNSPNTKSSKNVNNSNENNINVNQLNINGINPKTITKKKSSEIKTYVLTAESDISIDYYFYSFVINATSELEARRIAQFVGGKETLTKNRKKPFWTSNKHSSCKLLNKNELGVVSSSLIDC
jgi:hypothetical protein